MQNPSAPQPLAYLTADLPGIGGQIKQRPDDFIVTEESLYEPCGEGEHLYLFVERTGLTTLDVVAKLARKLGVTNRQISYAGLKDKHAISRQMFSIHLPGSESQDAQRVAFLEGEPYSVLWADRHNNKLRRGHLAGNRFDIRIRDVEPTAVIRAKRILDQLVASGVPNYFGPQRFGYRGDNHLVGRVLIKRDFQAALKQLLGDAEHCEHEQTLEARKAFDAGDYVTALEHWPRTLRYERQALSALAKGRSISKAIYSIAETQRLFYGSAAQSHLFNMVLNQRVANGTFAKLLPGDLAMKHENQSVFPVDTQQTETENAPHGRVSQCVISPSGPMWGSDLLLAQQSVGDMELGVLDEFDIPRQLIETCPLTRGSRRAMRVIIQNTDIAGGVDEHGSYVRLQFALSKGSFATVVLRELMKNDIDADSASGEA
ncbi:MAG TPA: tRNA pseudouridine(13) synthase TruD [Phycisphaerales bacterium]|nr:tRNA pseudouridine(13) synthase TruD [Phycisphaerales bacterium]|tara:strand:- start:38 stop:1327 length:1290 start_codon:yes stop_codon:yes gene_type:complete